MKRVTLLTAMTVLTVLVACFVVLRINSSDTTKQSQYPPVETFAEAPQPVGWVFGRLVGIPGSERPLTSSQPGLGCLPYSMYAGGQP